MAPTAGPPPAGPLDAWLPLKQLLGELQATVADASLLLPADSCGALPPSQTAGTGGTPSSSTPQSADSHQCCCPWDEVSGLADRTAARLQDLLVLHESQHMQGAALLVAQLTRKLADKRAREAGLQARCQELEATLAAAHADHQQALQALQAGAVRQQAGTLQQVATLQRQAAELSAMLAHPPGVLPGSPAFSAASSSLCNIAGLGTSWRVGM